MMDEYKTIIIPPDDADYYVDKLRDDMLDHKIPFDQQLQNIAESKKVKKVKFTKYKSHNQSRDIQIGDMVIKGIECGRVVDIDSDELCVEISGDEIVVWGINDVRRVGYDITNNC